MEFLDKLNRLKFLKRFYEAEEELMFKPFKELIDFLKDKIGQFEDLLNRYLDLEINK